MPFPYVFTFYSYKGGVGRSMALLNVAYELVARGRHVLVLDMDLEAPGISGFLERNNELEPPGGRRPEDILGLLSMAMDARRDQTRLEELPPVSRFVRSVRAEQLAPLQPARGKLGRLDVVGAHTDGRYLERLAGWG